jgi:hypothetical protein
MLRVAVFIPNMNKIINIATVIPTTITSAFKLLDNLDLMTCLHNKAIKNRTINTMTK